MAVPAANDDAIRSWASDWADSFDQGWDEEKLSKWIGKTVRLYAPPSEEGGDPRGAEVHVVGFSVDTLFPPPDEEDGAMVQLPKVHRFSFLTAEGVQVALYAKVEVSELEVE